MFAKLAVSSPPDPGHAQPQDTFRSWVALPPLAGAGLSVFATLRHVAARDLGTASDLCEVGRLWSCDAAMASRVAEWFGVPLSVYGFLFFLVFGVLLARPSPARRTQMQLMATVGVAIAVILAVYSLNVLGYFCPICVALYVSLILTAVATRASQVLRMKVQARDVVATALWGLLGMGFAQSFRPLRRPLSDWIERNLGRDALGAMVHADADDFQRAGVDRRDYRPMRLGDANAPLTIYYFVDFTCPRCENLKFMFSRLDQHVPGTYNVRLLHYPLESVCNPASQTDMHVGACRMAQIGHCAAQFEQFAAFYDQAWLIASAPDPVTEAAKSLAIDFTALNRCVESPTTAAAIQDDIKLAKRAHVRGTPTVYIENERARLEGGPSVIAQQIKRRLMTKAQAVKAKPSAQMSATLDLDLAEPHSAAAKPP